jgi:mono/diheme cytochrome c family protein
VTIESNRPESEMRRTLATILVLLPLPAAAQGPVVGGALAERWCMACHVIEREPPAAAANGIPSFPAIAARPSTTAESLDRFLSTAHTRMSDFSLSRNERSALIAYILSLR